MKFIRINSCTYLNVDNLEEVHFSHKGDINNGSWNGYFIFKNEIKKTIYIGSYEEVEKIKKCILELANE